MLREAFALTDQGAREFKRGVVSCAIANIVLTTPIGVLFMVTSEFMNHLVDPSATLPNLEFYLVVIVAVLAVMLLAQWFEYANTYNVVYAESARKRIELAERLRRLPLSFFGRRDLSDLTTTIMKDCADQERMFSHIMPQLFGSGISTLIIGAALFFVIDWRLALACLWPIPIAILLVAGSFKIQQTKTERENVKKLALADGIQEFLECAREIRATNQRNRFLDTLFKKVDEFEKAQISAELTTGVIVSSAQAFLRVGVATTILAGIILLVSGQIEFMVYFCFLLVVTRLYDPINTILEVIAELLNTMLSIKRMQGILNEPTQTGSTTFEPHGYDLVFNDVHFSYDQGESILNGISFTAKEGEVTALVGPSGSGKSTVAKLAARFWDADSGTVSVGGVDVSTIDPETLLTEYAEVFQDVVLFDDTVMGNIRLGRADASDAEVLAAAKAANCDEFAGVLPQGYDTIIGENGSRLSGGERQRISIARAILKDASIVLLDEATASLDVENESQVQKALSRLLVNKTVLVIAHRMRTVANADRIIVLDKGEISEQGTPAELSAKENGVYRRMAELQSSSLEWALQ